MAYGQRSHMSATAGSRAPSSSVCSLPQSYFLLGWLPPQVGALSGVASVTWGSFRLTQSLMFVTLKGGMLSPKDQFSLPLHGVGILADGLDPRRWERPSCQTEKIQGRLNCKTCHSLALLSFWDKTIYSSFSNLYNFVIASSRKFPISSSLSYLKRFYFKVVRIFLKATWHHVDLCMCLSTDPSADLAPVSLLPAGCLLGWPEFSVLSPQPLCSLLHTWCSPSHVGAHAWSHIWTSWGQTELSF